MRTWILFLSILLLCVGGVFSQKARSKQMSKGAEKKLDIRRVDFNKINYQLNGEEVRELGLTPKDVAVQEVEFGDLDGDDNEEAVVMMGWSWGRQGGSGHGTWIDIYTIDKNRVRLLTRFREEENHIENRSSKLVEISDSQLVIKRCDFEGDTIFTAIVFYRLTAESRLNQVKKLRFSNEDFPCGY
jgi:hypothetical protein